MAQYKKDEIKKRIDEAALYIFAEKGYEGTGISDIARKANVSVGNVYRYYKGKEEIFYSNIPESFLNQLKNSLQGKISSAKNIHNEASPTFLLMNEEFIDYMTLNRERILIIFKGAKGTRYEEVKDEMISYLIKTVRENYSGQNNDVIFNNENDYIIRMIYAKLIEMMMNIFMVSKDHLEIKNSLNLINAYHLFGVTELFK